MSNGSQNGGVANSFERCFKLWSTVCKLVLDGKRQICNVCQVLQGIVDHEGDVFVVPYAIYSSSASPSDQMKQKQERLYHLCLTDLRLWKPCTMGNAFHLPGFRNIVTDDYVYAQTDGSMVFPLRYQDPRIDSVLRKYGLSTTWRNAEIYRQDQIPFEVPWVAPDDVPTT